jgi:hypothetical protein
MEHSVKLVLFPRSWRLECEFMAVNTPPKLKLLLVLEQSLNWGSMDQELHQWLPLAGTLSTAYYSSHLYLWKVSSYLRFWKMGRIRFSSLGLGRLLDWTTFTKMFPATCSGSQLGFYKNFFKRGSGFPMVLSSRSKCMIVTYGRDIWPCSSYL